MKSEEIEVPIWLSDRIATRLEEAQTSRSKAPIWWSGWFRNFALGGLAVAAIGGALVGIVSRGGDTFVGGLFGSDSKQEPISVATTVNAAKIQYRVKGNHLEATSASVVTVSSGDVTSKFGGTAKGDLQNPNANPAVFSLQVDGKEFEIVVLPGTQAAASSELRSEGTLVEFAKAFSAVSGKPVRLPAEQKEKRVSWDFTGTDPFTDADRALESVSLGVDQRETGEIVLS